MEIEAPILALRKAGTRLKGAELAFMNSEGWKEAEMCELW